MPVPKLLLTPDESRDRSGPVTPTVSSANVDIGEGWHLWKGIGSATLLLSPDGSRSAAGVVTPGLSGGPSVVPGQYGQAWETGGAVRKVVTVNREPYMTETFTFIIRLKYNPPAVTGYPMRITANNVAVGRSGGIGVAIVGEDSALTGGDTPDGEWMVQAARRNLETRELYKNGVRVDTKFTTPLTFTAPDQIQLGQTGQGATIESAIVGPWMQEVEILRISSMPRRWEFGPAGTISAPLTGPLGSVLIRYREGGTVHHANLTGSGTFGTYGTVSISGGTIEFGTTREVDVLGVIAHEEALPPDQLQRLEDMPYWSWGGVVPQIGGVRIRISGDDLAALVSAGKITWNV